MFFIKLYYFLSNVVLASNQFIYQMHVREQEHIVCHTIGSSGFDWNGMDWVVLANIGKHLAANEIWYVNV